MSWDPSLVSFEAPADGRILSAVGGASGNMRLVNGQKIRFPFKTQEELADSVPPRVQAYESDVPGIQHKLIMLVDGAGLTGMDGYPQLSLESTFPDDLSGSGGAQGEPQAIIRSGALTGSDEALIVLTGDSATPSINLVGNVSISNLYSFTVADINATAALTVDSVAAMTLTAGADLTLATTGAGDDILLNSAATIQLTSTGTSSWTAAGLTLSSTEDILIGTTGAGDDITIDAVGNVAVTGAAISLISDGNGNVTITASGTGDLALTGAPVTINGIDISTGLGVWTDYTPTVLQSVTVSKTVTYSRYVKLGRTVIFEFYLVATSSGTATHALTVSLPVTAAQASLPVGMFYWYSTVGTDLNYVNPAYLASTTTMGGIIHGATTVFGNTQAGWPDQVVSGDSLLGFIIYEAAS